MIEQEAIARLLDRFAITDCIHAYARGVDRRDWALVRSVYHDDAHDEHGAYSGGVDGFIQYLSARHEDIEHSMHVVGQVCIEFIEADAALVESYIINSQRMRNGVLGERAPAGIQLGPTDALESIGFGRLVDYFTRVDGVWRVARRKLVPEVLRNSIALGQEKLSTMANVHRRDGDDPMLRLRSQFASNV